MNSRAATLRLARAADGRTLAAMARDYIEAGLKPRYTSLRIARLIAERDTVTVVAEEAGTILGFAVMTFSDEHAHLILLAVRPSQRRNGLGRRLLEWLVESAQVAGIASLHLELREDNPGARRFYRALGFTETLQIAEYYDGRIDAVRMIRMLRLPQSA